MSLEKESLNLLFKALTTLEEGFRILPTFDPPIDTDTVEQVLLEVAQRMKDNYPYFHPLYIGQMLKPPHPIARLAYVLSMWINPNNHALDGGRCSSHMEKEAVENLAKMFCWERHLGHLCSGGTMANLEALWISRSLHPGKVIAASQQAHYTHERICKVLQIPFREVRCNSLAQMDMNSLEDLLQQGEVGTVVATIGTTGAGAVDPLSDIIELRDRYNFRIHADAAYGGYFTLVDNLQPGTRGNLDLLNKVDSLVVDPHKHGLQPYGCGCVLFKDPSVGRFYKHDSPYTYFSSSELHLGEISLECSRPGASAVALWATQKLLPMIPGGEFAQGLAKCRAAALDLHNRLLQDHRFMSALAPELDIVIWAPYAKTSRDASLLSDKIFREAAAHNLHMAVATFPRSMLESHWPHLSWDTDSVQCLRTCLMKPEHLDWMDEIWGILDQTANCVMHG